MFFFCLSMIIIEIDTPEVDILFTLITPNTLSPHFRGPLPPGYSSETENYIYWRYMLIGDSGKECASALCK